MTSDPAPAASTDCWCCGTTKPAEELVRLGCHDEVALCEDCIGWLADERAGRPLRGAVPVLATGDVTRALAHDATLGFETEEWTGGGYGFARRDGVELHIGQPDGLDPTTNTATCYLHVRDADALYTEWVAARVAGELHAPIDTDYGMREGSHIDPDGNTVRFGSPLVGSQRTAERDMRLATDDPVAEAVTTAIHQGDLDTLHQLLHEHPDLATARLGDLDQSRTLLHIATDWPGHFPNVAATIAFKIESKPTSRARSIHRPRTASPVPSGPRATATSNRSPRTSSPAAPTSTGSAGATSPRSTSPSRKATTSSPAGFEPRAPNGWPISPDTRPGSTATTATLQGLLVRANGCHDEAS
jgi:hypothetical protein